MISFLDRILFSDYVSFLGSRLIAGLFVPTGASFLEPSLTFERRLSFFTAVLRLLGLEVVGVMQ